MVTTIPKVWGEAQKSSQAASAYLFECLRVDEKSPAAARLISAFNHVPALVVPTMIELRTKFGAELFAFATRWVRERCAGSTIADALESHEDFAPAIAKYAGERARERQKERDPSVRRKRVVSD